MKKSILFFGILMISMLGFSQTYEGSATYEKKKQPALVVDYDYSPEAVRNAIVQKFSRMGYTVKEEKGLFNKDKGYIVFSNATVRDISSASYDYIINIEDEGRKNQTRSRLSMLMNKNSESAIGSLTSDELGQAKMFLNNMLPEIEEAKLEIEIKDQEATVTKAEKKLKDLMDDQKSMEKKIADLQSDLQKNAENQEKQQQEIETQKQNLDGLKAKRRVSQD